MRGNGFGVMNKVRAMSRFVAPVATSRAMSASRAVSGDSGSSPDRPPRSCSAAVSSGSARVAFARSSARRASSSAWAGRRDLVAQRLWSSNAKTPSQYRPCSSQNRPATASDSLAFPVWPSCRCSRPLRMSDSAEGCGNVPQQQYIPAAIQPGSGRCGVAGRKMRTDTGDHEREQVRGVAYLGRPHMNQVGGHVVLIVETFGPGGVVDTLPKPGKCAVVVDKHRRRRGEHPVPASRLGFQAGVLGAGDRVLQPVPSRFQLSGKDQHRAESGIQIARGRLVGGDQREEAVQRIHERAGHPCDQVFEIPIEI